MVVLTGKRGLSPIYLDRAVVEATGGNSGLAVIS